jgi:predicted DNA-binding transcriptional regulator YafY
MSTSTRMLQLLSLLQTHRAWSGTELAQRLEVSLRTLRRDVDRLRELGYPVNAQRGADGGYQLAPGASLPPLVLDDEEAVALALGLQAAARTPVAGMPEASVRALAKVVRVLPARLRRRVEALEAATTAAPWTGAPAAVDPLLLTTLAQACADGERLDLDYAPREGSGPGTRRVEPHRLVPLGRRWYLVAYDLSRLDWRTFRIDRASAARPTGERFAPRTLPATDAAAFVRERLEALPAAHDVSARVAAPPEDVTARVGRWATVADDGSGGSRVSLRVEELEWALLTLGSVQAELSDVEPPELADLLHSWGGRFSRAAVPRAARGRPAAPPTG